MQKENYRTKLRLQDLVKGRNDIFKINQSPSPKINQSQKETQQKNGKINITQMEIRHSWHLTEEKTLFWTHFRQKTCYFCYSTSELLGFQSQRVMDLKALTCSVFSVYRHHLKLLLDIMTSEPSISSISVKSARTHYLLYFQWDHVIQWVSRNSVIRRIPQ